jgi:hypothetical protein
MFTRITDTALLNAGIVQWGKDGQKHRAKGHVLLVSALAHVATHGNVAVLNNMFKIADTNTRNAIRNYVRRFQTEMVLTDNRFTPKRDDEGNEVQTPIAFLEFSKQEFHVIGGHMDHRTRFVEFSDKNLIEPSKRWPAYYDINILAERQRFDTMSLATRIKSLLKNAEKNRENINPKVLKRLEESVSYISAIADNMTDEAAEGAQTDADMSRLGQEFNNQFDAMFDPKPEAPAEAATPAPVVKASRTKHPAANA